MSFADLGISPAVCAALEARGIDSPFPIQRKVVPDVLAGHDVLVKSPTGSGKTLAFASPLTERVEAEARRPAALVLAPTRELAVQIAEEMAPLANARALSVATVYGGVGIEKQARLARRAHILVATPGRLLDLMQRGDVTLEHVRFLVLDEADRMLDMGFKPAVDRIVKATPRDRQTLLFSATLDGEVSKIAAAYTSDARAHEHVPEGRPTRVEHRFRHVSHPEKLDVLVTELSVSDRDLALVFVRTKRGADRLVKRLASRGVDAAAMHGDKSQGQRQRALARFAAGKVSTLVATDVAARGIDVDGISHIINFDPPADREGYVHRIGRTARAGRAGVGVTLVMGDQARDVGEIARGLGLHREFDGIGGSRGGSRNGSRTEGSRNGGPRTQGARNGSSRYGDGNRNGSGNGRSRGRRG